MGAGHLCGTRGGGDEEAGEGVAGEEAGEGSTCWAGADDEVVCGDGGGRSGRRGGECYGAHGRDRKMDVE